MLHSLNSYRDIAIYKLGDERILQCHADDLHRVIRSRSCETIVQLVTKSDHIGARNVVNVGISFLAECGDEVLHNIVITARS